MAELGTRTIRVKLDTSVALPSNLDIASWRGNALDLEVGIFDTSSTVASITNVTSVNVKVQASQTDNTTLMDSTVAFASMDAGLTAATWTDGTAQHATFEFTNAQANLTITDSSCKYWIVFTALLSSGDTVTLAAGDFTLWEDNDTTAGDPDVNPGTAITLEEADARYSLTSHTHLSADVTDSTSDGNATPSVLLKTNEEGALTVGGMRASEYRVINGANLATINGSNLSGSRSHASPNGNGTYALVAATTGAIASTDVSGLGTAAASSTGDFATAAQGATADSAVQPASTDTLTNKRMSPRITIITSSATPTVNSDNCDMVTITALAAAVTSMTSSLTGTPSNGEMLLFRIKDNGTARAITWGASFVAMGAALPTTTVLSKTLHALFIWDSVNSTWGCLSSAQEA